MIRRAVALCVVCATAAHAQPATIPEARLDAFVGARPGAQLAAGVVTDAGAYARIAFLVGVGAERRPGGAITGVQRAEVIGRYFVDPFRRASIGAYFAGGLSVRHTAGGPARAALVAMLGVERKPHGGVTQAIELGVGGGARIGVAVRRARADRR